RVEHRGNAGTGNLHVMGMQRRPRIPEHAGPWPIVVFQVVGMKLHKTRDQVVAIEVLAALRCAGIDGGNDAVTAEQTSLDDGVSQDDPCVAKAGFSHQPCAPSLKSATRRKGLPASGS